MQIWKKVLFTLLKQTYLTEIIEQFWNPLFSIIKCLFFANEYKKGELTILQIFGISIAKNFVLKLYSISLEVIHYKALFKSKWNEILTSWHIGDMFSHVEFIRKNSLSYWVVA